MEPHGLTVLLAKQRPDVDGKLDGFVGRHGFLAGTHSRITMPPLNATVASGVLSALSGLSGPRDT